MLERVGTRPLDSGVRFAEHGVRHMFYRSLADLLRTCPGRCEVMVCRPSSTSSRALAARHTAPEMMHSAPVPAKRAPGGWGGVETEQAKQSERCQMPPRKIYLRVSNARNDGAEGV